ncbi:putative cyclin-dependent protein kinase inhibitor SMR [Helianthus anomalus]
MNSDNLKQHDHNSTTLKSQHHQNNNNNITPLSIQLPSSNQEINTGDEPTTPTSQDHKIPAPATCPPAPRKPRLIPVGNKRKTPNVSRISVDLMVIFDAMFVPPVGVAGNGVLAGDDGAGERVKKVKKVKKADVTIG